MIKQMKESWQDRFENFDKTLIFLNKNAFIENPTELEKAGIIHSFEVCFELACDTIKDYLKYKDVLVQECTRDVIIEAFSYGIIKKRDFWFDMLKYRNFIPYTYLDNLYHF